MFAFAVDLVFNICSYSNVSTPLTVQGVEGYSPTSSTRA